MKLLLFIAIFLSACAKHAEKSAPSDKRSALADAYGETKAQLEELTDETGWPSKTDCDGTLWAGLACAGGFPVNIDLAEYEPGKIHRRPAPSCWEGEDHGSKSTVSDDMLMGYLWCRWERKDLAALQRLAAYGETHNWVMGEPASEVARVVMKPNTVGLLGRALSALGYERGYRDLPQAYFPVANDYERHLQALAVVLYGEVTSVHTADLVEVSDNMFSRLEALVEAEPENPGFATALGIYTGDLSRAIDLFLDPATPMPTYTRGDNVAAYAAAERLFWMTKALDHMRN